MAVVKKMAFIYTNMVLFFLLLVLGAVFLFYKQRIVNIGVGIAIIYLMFHLGINIYVTIILSCLIIVVSFNYLFSKSNKLMMTGLLLLPLLLVGSVMAAELPDVVDTPPGLVKFVEEVGSVKSQPRMTMTGTDYAPFDDGKLMVYLTVGEYPVDYATCYINVLYPNMTSFINNIFMFPVTNEYFDGMYYYDFIVPNTTGVYPVNAHCFYNSTVNNDLVVSTASGSFIEAEDGTDYYLMYYVDEDYYRVKDKGECNDINCSFFFNISLPIGWYNDLLVDSRVMFTGKLDDDKDDIHFYAHYVGGRQLLFSIIAKDVIFNEQVVLNDSFANLTTLVIEAEAFDWDNSKLFVDYLVFKRVYNGSYVGDLRGNDELVVSRGIAEIIEVIISDTPLITTAALLSMLILFVAIVLLFTSYKVVSGLLFMLWPVLFSEDIYITIILLFLGFVVLYRGFKEIKDKK